MFLVNEFVDTFHGYEDQCDVIRMSWMTLLIMGHIF